MSKSCEWGVFANISFNWEALGRFKFCFGQPAVSVILHQQKSRFTFTPHGEFGFALGAAQNGAILMYIPSRSVHRVYWSAQMYWRLHLHRMFQSLMSIQPLRALLMTRRALSGSSMNWN
jgi:hypothetical protein